MVLTWRLTSHLNGHPPSVVTSVVVVVVAVAVVVVVCSPVFVVTRCLDKPSMFSLVNTTNEGLLLED